LPEAHSLARPAEPRRCFALTGPSPIAETGHLPVRGDLAHIRLAGRCFVPHYAVPVRYAAKAQGAALRVANRAEADAICELAKGELFDVLDIAGDWAWGQLGEDGPVGYVAIAQLARADQ
jgi:hypothetical protein